MKRKMYNSYNFAYKTNTPDKVDSVEKKERISFDVTDDLDFERLLTMFETVVVDVWARWCEPCKRIADSYEELGKKYAEFIKEKRLILLKDDIDAEGTIHRDQIEAVPTFFIYYKGRLYKKIVGSEFADIDGILEKLIQGEGEFEEAESSFEGI